MDVLEIAHPVRIPCGDDNGLTSFLDTTVLLGVSGQRELVIVWTENIEMKVASCRALVPRTLQPEKQKKKSEVTLFPNQWNSMKKEESARLSFGR